jgi:hypothetical protein
VKYHSDPEPPLYKTDLAQTPLPEILVKIHHYNVPGRLECRRGHDVKLLTIERGEIVFSTTPIEETLLQIFSWDSGSAVFIPGRNQRHFKLHQAAVPIRQAIVRGVALMPDARLLLSRIGTKSTLLQRTDLPIDVPLTEDEQALLEAANGKRTLVEIVNQPGNPAGNARTLYALFILGFLRERRRRRIRVQLKTKTSHA